MSFTSMDSVAVAGWCSSLRSAWSLLNPSAFFVGKDAERAGQAVAEVVLRRDRFAGFGDGTGGELRVVPVRFELAIGEVFERWAGSGEKRFDGGCFMTQVWFSSGRVAAPFDRTRWQVGRKCARVREIGLGVGCDWEN